MLTLLLAAQLLISEPIMVAEMHWHQRYWHQIPLPEEWPARKAEEVETPEENKVYA